MKYFRTHRRKTIKKWIAANIKTNKRSFIKWGISGMTVTVATNYGDIGTVGAIEASPAQTKALKRQIEKEWKKTE